MMLMLRLRAENQKYEWGRNCGTIPSLHRQIQPLNREIKHRLANTPRTASEIKYPRQLLTGLNYLAYRVFTPLSLTGLQVHHFFRFQLASVQRTLSLKYGLYGQEQNLNFVSVFPFYKFGRGSPKRLHNFIATNSEGDVSSFYRGYTCEHSLVFTDILWRSKANGRP